MIVTKKSLPRRTFLRGAGVALSLPLLDAMIPAATAQERTLLGRPPRRMQYVFIPMGTDHSRWIPYGEFAELSPILSPFDPVKDDIAVITNLDLKPAYPETHATSNASFLSCATAKHTESSDYYLGTTVDQIAARVLGLETPLPSLELSMDLLQTVGQCNNGYACVYQNNLSWSSPTSPLPSEAHPRMVFERLFGAGGTLDDRRAAWARRASLLDWVGEDFARLKKKLGGSDRARVDGYLDSIREVERQIQRAEHNAADNPLPDLDRPRGVPAAYADHARLMFELQALALQGDISRVITFQLARETSNRTYPEVGVPDSHHPLSHHGNDPAKIERMSRINKFHVSLFAEYMQLLKSIPEGEGTLLDNTVLLYGSGMGNPSTHDHDNLPIVVAGGAAHGIGGGQHIAYDELTPLANLHVTLMQGLGVPLQQFGDSNGKVEGLFVDA